MTNIIDAKSLFGIKQTQTLKELLLECKANDTPENRKRLIAMLTPFENNINEIMEENNAHND